MNVTRTDSVEGITEAIYGLVLSTAVVAALSEDRQITARELVAGVAVTALVFWLAHVYARVMASRLVDGGTFSLQETWAVMRLQWPLVLGALPALAALTLGWVDLVSLDTAVNLAIGAGVAALACCGLVIARQRRLSLFATVVATVLSGGLGLLMVGLKFAIH